VSRAAATGSPTGAALPALALAALASLATAAAAHHSLAAYDEDRQIRLEGLLVSFAFVNPHARLELVVTDAQGRKAVWLAEWGGAGTLLGQGVREDSFVKDDALVLTGNPARDPQLHELRLTSVLRPRDGFSWGLKGETAD
jgi:hypothetical protein